MRFLLAVLFLLIAHNGTFAKPKPKPSPKPNPEPWHVFLNGQMPGMNMGGMGMQGGMGMGGMGMGGMGMGGMGMGGMRLENPYAMPCRRPWACCSGFCGGH